ncbi:MAG: hypothetical protein V1913_06625 [Fibrobacterota bacterium]
MNCPLKNNDGRADLKVIAGMALFLLVALALGPFIAKKIYHVPTRLDLLVFVTLLILVPVMKYPTVGVYFLILVPPFIPLLRRFYYLFYDRPGNDLLLILPDVVVMLLFILYLDQVRKRRKIRSEDPRLNAWIWAFVLYNASRIVLLTYNDTMGGINQFKFNMLYLLCFFFAIHFIETKQQVVRIFKITSLIGLVVALYGIKQTYLGYTRFEEIWLDQMRSSFVTLFISGRPRPFSTLSSPATFGDFMIIAFLTSYCLYSMKGTRFRWLYLFILPVLSFGLLLTSVRSNWVGFLAGMAIWFLIAHRSSFRIKLGLFILIIVFYFPLSILMEQMGRGGTAGPIYGTATPTAVRMAAPGAKGITDLFVTERVSAITNPFQEHSMVARTVMWQQVLSQIVELPRGPMGYGLGTFDAHSLYFTTLFETGFIGLFLLLFVFYRIFRAGFRAYREEEEEDKKIMVRGLLTLLFVFVIMNSTGTHIDAHPGDIYFWFSAGILMVIRTLKSGREEELQLLAARIRDAT